MTVSDLISILQQHDPAAVVVTRWDVDIDALTPTHEELRRGAVQAVQLHRLPEASGWDPLGGATLYEELLNDDAEDSVKGVLLG
jgi:hypothetical protein